MDDLFRPVVARSAGNGPPVCFGQPRRLPLILPVQRMEGRFPRMRALCAPACHLVRLAVCGDADRMEAGERVRRPLRGAHEAQEQAAGQHPQTRRAQRVRVWPPHRRPERDRKGFRDQPGGCGGLTARRRGGGLHRGALAQARADGGDARDRHADLGAQAAEMQGFRGRTPAAAAAEADREEARLLDQGHELHRHSGHPRRQDQTMPHTHHRPAVEGLGGVLRGDRPQRRAHGPHLGRRRQDLQGRRLQLPQAARRRQVQLHAAGHRRGPRRRRPGLVCRGPRRGRPRGAPAALFPRCRAVELLQPRRPRLHEVGDPVGSVLEDGAGRSAQPDDGLPHARQILLGQAARPG